MPSLQQPNASAPLVLVVEDYVDAREMYVEYLKLCGFRVLEAGNGLSAVEQAILHRPDVIVMDMALPGIDGWEATRRIRRHAATSGIPVVALTGHALVGHADAARLAGCDAFVVKPCAPDRLVEELERVMGERRRRRDDRRRDGGRPQDEGPPPKPNGSRSRGEEQASPTAQFGAAEDSHGGGDAMRVCPPDERGRF